ncbi:MAG TPA: response regulator transcription factor [Elusimicrobiales bacterium]|nr:response regulator transcription factor [Elusimicrobiales bacterium]
MRVLIAEDEKKIAEFIKRGLREEGYAADIAPTGHDALTLAEENPYDLLLLDVMLPGLDGVEVCSRLRAAGFTAPIMMLTAKDRVEDKVKGLDSGANDYLTKPFAFEELLARVRALLRAKPSEASNILRAGDIELNLPAHKALRSGKELDLSAKEFSLLEYLVRNKDRIVTRTMIAEHVWDINFDTGTNVIDVYINYLRRKLEKNPAKKIIRTVRGKGYLLKSE